MSGVAAAVTQTKTPRGGGSTAQESKRQPSAKHLGEISILTNHKHLRRRDTKFNKEEFEEELKLYQSVLSENPWVIDPNCKYMQRWDMVTFVALIFTAIVTPAEVAFVTTTWKSALFGVNRLVDLIFIKDMIMQFFVAYIDTAVGARLVKDLRKIRSRYFCGWFIIDLVSILPFDVLSQIFEDQPWLTQMKTVRVIRLLRLLKLVRVFRASRIFARWETAIAIPYSTIGLVKARAPRPGRRAISPCAAAPVARRRRLAAVATVSPPRDRRARSPATPSPAHARAARRAAHRAPPLLSFRRARLQFIVLMLITSHWFACIWGMCADLQGEDYESFTWLDALYYATEAQVGRGRTRGHLCELAALGAPRRGHVDDRAGRAPRPLRGALAVDVPDRDAADAAIGGPHDALVRARRRRRGRGRAAVAARRLGHGADELAQGRRALPAQVRPQRGLALQRQVELAVRQFSCGSVLPKYG